MRINLNERATSEFLQIMEVLGITNPTHAMNMLVSKWHKTAFPNSEDKDASRTTNQSLPTV